MIRTVLAELRSFLAHPTPQQASGLDADGAIARWAILTAMQVAVLGAVIMPLILAWQKAFGLSPPNAFDGMGPLALWGGAVILGPVLEELFFRGWMSGTRRALTTMGVLLIGACVVVAMRGNKVAVAIALVGMLVATAITWWVKRRDENVPRGFGKVFPALFYATTVIFAALHLFNYPAITLAAVPMALPQFWSGLMFGHMRVRVGMVGAILNHIVSNAVMLGAALVTG